MTKTTDVSVVGISETKFDNSVSSGEFEIEGHNLLRFDRSWRGGGVACYVNKFLEHNYKHSFCKNTERILTNIFLPKTKPVLVSILYRPPDKNDFVKNLQETFTKCNISEKQECYLLGDFNINLLHNGENIFERRGRNHN